MNDITCTFFIIKIFWKNKIILSLLIFKDGALSSKPAREWAASSAEGIS